MNAARHDDLTVRLARLGDALDVGEATVDDRFVADVVERLGVPQRTRHDRSSNTRRISIAAAVAAAAVGGIIADPGSRSALAGWLGLDGVEIRLDPDVTDPSGGGRPDPLGPGQTEVIDVDGRRIVVSVVAGELSETVITKTVGSSDQVTEVTVDGARGLWIAGRPHEIAYESGRGVVVERIAENTLVWNTEAGLRRVEGFVTLEDALGFVEQR